MSRIGIPATKLLVGVLSLASLAVSGCPKKAPPLPAVTPLEHPVIYSGCADIRVGPVCELRTDKALTVWMPDGEQVTAFAVDGVAVESTAQDGVAGGVLHALTIRPPARELSMVVDVAGAKRAWHLALADAVPFPARVAEARKIYFGGDSETAATILSDALKDAVGDERCAIVTQLGKVEASRDNVDVGIPLLLEARSCLEASGRLGRAAEVASVLVEAYVSTWRFADARTALLREEGLVVHLPEYFPVWQYDMERLARETGDLRTFLRMADQVESNIRRTGDFRLAQYALQEHAATLEELGRVTEALALLRGRSGPSVEKPFDRSFRLTTLGRVMLLARELGATTDDPRPVLEEASSLHRGLGDKSWEFESRLLLAQADLQVHDVAGARQHLALAKAVTDHPPPERLLQQLADEAEVELAGNRPLVALGHFERLGALARSLDRVAIEWTAAEGAGRSLLRLGQRRRALSAFAVAEKKLSEASRAVPLGQGRDTYLAARERSGRQRVDALLEVDAEQAFRAAREARARIIADAQMNDRITQLSQSDRAAFEQKIASYMLTREQFDRALERDWTLDSSNLAKATRDRSSKQAEARAAYEAAFAALPPPVRRAPQAPSAGELWLGYFPVSEGWAAFAATRGFVRAVRLGPVDPRARADALSAQLLTPFALEILKASRIILLPSGALSDVDIHALPFNGQPLISQAPVEYTLDLGPSTMDTNEGRLLAVVDAREDLPGARQEATLVMPFLAGREVATVLRGGQASRTAVLDDLPRADLFYYAGHGVSAGRDGWDSALLLAGQSALGAGDILALPHVPRTVVLSGCEMARSVRMQTMSGAPVGLGIAQAFLAAGANHAIATTRDVLDGDSVTLVTRAAARLGDRADVGTALRDAQLSLLVGGTDWSAFRVLRR